MEDLISYVSEQAKLPLPTAKVVASATLDYLDPHFSPLLKSSIEVLLRYPGLSDAEKDILIAARVLFPKNTATKGPPRLDD